MVKFSLLAVATISRLTRLSTHEPFVSVLVRGVGFGVVQREVVDGGVVSAGSGALLVVASRRLLVGVGVRELHSHLGLLRLGPRQGVLVGVGSCGSRLKRERSVRDRGSEAEGELHHKMDDG